MARTIQWDETEAWEVFRFAEFGRESAMGRDYGPVNGMYRGLLQEAYDAGVNLQLIQKVKEKWVNEKPTGDFEPVGFKQANYIVQVNISHAWSRETGFVSTIVNCRQNVNLWGMDFVDLTFNELGQFVYPDTTAEDWQ